MICFLPYQLKPGNVKREGHEADVLGPISRLRQSDLVWLCCGRMQQRRANLYPNADEDAHTGQSIYSYGHANISCFAKPPHHSPVEHRCQRGAWRRTATQPRRDHSRRPTDANCSADTATRTGCPTDANGNAYASRHPNNASAGCAATTRG